MFENARFIKAQNNFDLAFCAQSNPNPLFYKSFTLDEAPKSATLSFCALGLGYAYVNGKGVSENLFAPPFGNYLKRLWYVSYDVTHLLKKGENILCFSVGNGFFNEDTENDWGSEKAPWRDCPKVIGTLLINGSTEINTDSSFLYSGDSPYLMNRLRLGVIYDARREENDLYCPSLKEKQFKNAVIDNAAPKGEFTLCTVEGIKEFDRYLPVQIIKKNDGRVIFDFGFNHSGIIHFSTNQRAGDEIIFRYAESLDGNLELNYNERTKLPYHQGEFATDRYICSGRKTTWANRFAYFGFRFVEAQGLDLNADYKIESVFTHHSIERCSTFGCSNEALNKLFACGIRSAYSNMYYMPTDCPTREKLGWMNDSQSSCEQFLLNFKAEKLFEKWLTDIKDAMTEEGELPGVVPTHGWGYAWGNGPVSDGCFFEVPYRLYLHYGNAEPLISCIPYFHRYFAFLKTKENGDGLVNFGLYDWANPKRNREFTPRTLINALLTVKFCRIAALAESLNNGDASRFKGEEQRQISLIEKHFLTPKGQSKINEQTACAMLIYFEIGNKEALGEQLLALVEADEYHHNCGMVGLRYLLWALKMTGNSQAALTILTKNGNPSYYNWLLDGATTLYEFWDMKESKNHHMYSDFMSWLIKTVVGISPCDTAPTFERVVVEPEFLNTLSYAFGSVECAKGEVKVSWKRQEKGIELTITAPTDNYVFYKGKALDKGENRFII